MNSADHRSSWNSSHRYQGITIGEVTKTAVANISSYELIFDSEQIPTLLGFLFLQNLSPIDATGDISS